MFGSYKYYRLKDSVFVNLVMICLLFLFYLLAYVQTPTFYDGPTDDWMQIKIPHGFLVFFSVLLQDLGREYWSDVDDCVKVYIGSRRFRRLAWTLCGKGRPFGPKRLFSVGTIMLHLVRRSFSLYTGMKMLLTFHKESDGLVHQLPDGRWNCSVPRWSDFKEHFPCNLIQECDGGEDEASCPYTTQQCGSGLVTVGDLCLKYFYDPTKVITLDGAFHLCKSQGGKLPVVNTPERLRAMQELLKMLRPFFTENGEATFPVGAKSSHPMLPLM